MCLYLYVASWIAEGGCPPALTVLTAHPYVLPTPRTFRIYHGNKMYDHTNDGLEVLGISADNLQLPKPAIIATAVVSLVLVVVLAGLSLARSFIEAAHDATGAYATGRLVVHYVSNHFDSCCSQRSAFVA